IFVDDRWQHEPLPPSPRKSDRYRPVRDKYPQQPVAGEQNRSRPSQIPRNSNGPRYSASTIVRAYEVANKNQPPIKKEVAMQLNPLTYHDYQNISPTEIGRRVDPGVVLTQGLKPQPSPLDAPIAQWTPSSMTTAGPRHSPARLFRQINKLRVEVSRVQMEFDQKLRAKKEFLRRVEAEREIVIGRREGRRGDEGEEEEEEAVGRRWSVMAGD
ncbi:MAG: hypothetical protein MMC33_007090, partial [Icmadophila ericetorum]|nr:hypothetical protein [Icmadophila ericetorum]